MYKTGEKKRSYSEIVNKYAATVDIIIIIIIMVVMMMMRTVTSTTMMIIIMIIGPNNSVRDGRELKP